MDTPLIYTSKGNVPEASLELQVIWDDQPEYVKCRLLYLLDGEIVKESAYALARKGISLAGGQFQVT